MVVYQCDLCGRIRDCVHKIIEQKEYDLCFRCWTSLLKKLAGKGRALGNVELTLLPASASKHACVEEEVPHDDLFARSKKPN